jgi:hypothetical protein
MKYRLNRGRNVNQTTRFACFYVGNMHMNGTGHFSAFLSTNKQTKQTNISSFRFWFTPILTAWPAHMTLTRSVHPYASITNRCQISKATQHLYFDSNFEKNIG